MNLLLRNFSLVFSFLVLASCGGGGSDNNPPANAAPIATAVSITDNNFNSVLVGDVLTGNYTYSDAEGDAEGVSTFRWLRDGIAITGETNSTYTLVSADSGGPSITFEVTPIAATGSTTGSVVTSVGIVVNTSAPTATSVSISDNNGGDVVAGDVLTGNYTYSDADGDAEGTSIFRWLRNGVSISGASSSSYTLVTADNGTTITFEVTPVAATGSTTGSVVTSAGIVVNTAPTATSVSISDNNGGDVLVGDVLTGNYTYSDADGDTEGTSIFRWLRNGVSISGASSSSYILVTADSGNTITFEVTPVAATGFTYGSSVTSGPVLPKTSVQITWNVNPDTAVNQSGGGYKVYYSSNSGFTPGDLGVIEKDIAYVSGATTPVTTQITLDPGRYYIRVAAYSALNAPGSSAGSISTATPQTTLLVP